MIGVLLTLCFAALLGMTRPALSQGVECVPPPLGKWCPSSGVIGCYFGTGIQASFLDRNYVALRTAMEDWNIELASSGYYLEDRGGCTGCGGDPGEFPTDAILFEYVPLGNGGCAAPGDGFAARTDRYTVAGGEISRIVKAVVRLNSNEAWSGSLRNAVARHELGHALGMGHVGGACGGVMLMSPGDCTGATRLIDDSARNGLQCLYGGGATCADKYGIRMQVSDLVRFVREHCVCEGGCATPARAQADAGRTYELAISDSGGPYQVFANLAESDWVGRAYDHSFSESHVRAIVRLRVFDGGTMIDEAYTTDPEDITGTVDAPAGARLARVARAYPNPFSSNARIEFELDREQEVLVSVHDLAGRRLLTLMKGSLPAGQHQVVLDRRAIEAVGGRSGAYFYTVRIGPRVERGTLLFVR